MFNFVRILFYSSWLTVICGATSTQTLVYRTGWIQFSFTLNGDSETVGRSLLARAGALLPHLAGLEAQLEGHGKHLTIELGCGQYSPASWQLDDGPETTLECEDGEPLSTLKQIISEAGFRELPKTSRSFTTIQLASFPDGPLSVSEMTRWRDRMELLEVEEGVYVSGDSLQTALWMEPASRKHVRILFGLFPDPASAKAFLHRHGLAPERFLFPARRIRLDQPERYFGRR